MYRSLKDRIWRHPKCHSQPADRVYIRYKNEEFMVLTRSAQAEVIEEADIEYLRIASMNRDQLY